jgi:uncharacterized protein (TIGR03083 family)
VEELMMSERGHTWVAESLGSWAVNACEDDEARAVEEHLAGCTDCGPEANRLRLISAALGHAYVAPITPAPGLRENVLTAARRRRRPGSAGMKALIGSYAYKVAALDGLLAELSTDQWETPVPKHGTVRGLVAHLTSNDALIATGLGVTERRVGAHATGHSIHQTWQAQSQLLLRRLSHTGPDQLDRPARLAGRDGPSRGRLRDAVAQRVFETWIHTSDIQLALGRTLEPPSGERIRVVVELVAHLLPQAMRALGLAHPGQTARLMLTGPCEGVWLIPLDTEAIVPDGEPGVTVIADAAEFCRLCGNRRTVEEFAYQYEGDQTLALDLLRAAVTLGCD